MDVGDLLHLQRAFKRDRIMNPAAEIKEILRTVIALGQLFRLVFAAKQGFQFSGNQSEFSQQLLGFLRADRTTNFPEVHGEQEQRCQLCSKRLGRSHADFRSRVRVNRPIGFARNHGADHVANAESLCSLGARLAHRGDGVGRFARLRDEDVEIVRASQRIAVAIFAGIVHLDRQLGEALDHELGSESCVPTGAAGGDGYVLKFAKVVLGDVHLVEKDLAGIEH